MSKNKLKNMLQTHGAIIEEELTGLDKVFDKHSSHRVNLASKYEDRLSQMDIMDLKDLAEELGIIPIDNRNVLIKAIKKEFKKK